MRRTAPTTHEGVSELQHLLHILLRSRCKLWQLGGPLVRPVYPAAGLQVFLHASGTAHRRAVLSDCGGDEDK